MGTLNTRMNFINAFWKLYEKKSIEKISINELCREAGYNRTTFYVYYDNIYDLLDKAIDVMFQPIKEKLFASGNFHDILGSKLIAEFFFDAFSSENHNLEILFKRNHQWIFGEKIKNEIFRLIKNSYGNPEADFQNIEGYLEYHVSAVIGSMRFWFNNREKLAEEDFVKMIYDISSKGVLNMMLDEINAMENKVKP